MIDSGVHNVWSSCGLSVYRLENSSLVSTGSQQQQQQQLHAGNPFVFNISGVRNALKSLFEWSALIMRLVFGLVLGVNTQVIWRFFCWGCIRCGTICIVFILIEFRNGFSVSWNFWWEFLNELIIFFFN